jgi:DNA-binding NarL/FixJ family response regulator
MACESMRLLIVDDHVAARVGLRLRLMREPDLHIVGEAGDLRQALELAEVHAPDVVLLDLSLPDGDGLDLVEPLRKVAPTSKCVVLTLEDSLHNRRRAHAMGVRVVVGKHEPTEVLLQAIRAPRN